MDRLRVLIAEDSAAMRRLIAAALAGDPQIEVAAQAGDGWQALQILERDRIDVMILDAEMPQLDGLQTLAEMQRRGLTTPVLVFSAGTAAGAALTLELLARGAKDYVMKPVHSGGPQQAQAEMRAALMAKLHGLFVAPLVPPPAADPALFPAPPPAPAPAPEHHVVPERASERARAAARETPAPAPRRRRPAFESAPELVAIGCSTGGPNALAEIIPALPPRFPAPILIVQHMPPVFTRLLAERLAQRSKVQVVEACEGMLVQPGVAYIAPGDLHLEVSGRLGALRLRTTQAPQEHGCRPSVDVLFRSIALACGGQTLAVVLTGMGQDGFQGARALRDQGAHVLAQDEATSVVWGLPGFVARAGLAERVLPVGEIAAEIVRRVQPAAVARHAG